MATPNNTAARMCHDPCINAYSWSDVQSANNKYSGTTHNIHHHSGNGVQKYNKNIVTTFTPTMSAMHMCGVQAEWTH